MNSHSIEHGPQYEDKLHPAARVSDREMGDFEEHLIGSTYGQIVNPNQKSTLNFYNKMTNIK